MISFREASRCFCRISLIAGQAQLDILQVGLENLDLPRDIEWNRRSLLQPLFDFGEFFSATSTEGTSTACSLIRSRSSGDFA
jgi:hypothetical protein